MLLKFSQLKLSIVVTSTIISLFKVFRIKQALKSTKMNNERKNCPNFRMFEQSEIFGMFGLKMSESIKFLN
jgi:hypothetical protein